MDEGCLVHVRIDELVFHMYCNSVCMALCTHFIAFWP